MFKLLLISFIFVAGFLQAETEDPPQIVLGERLFKESRFAQLFFTQSKNVNQPLKNGDPILENLEKHPSPFRGQTVSCSSCHLVDQAKNLIPFGNRNYSDFNSRPAIPVRADLQTTSPRHSPGFVGIVPIDGKGLTLHFDGEFSDFPDLIISGWTGRNFGWLPQEYQIARAHIARVIREDNGQFKDSGYELSKGHSYSQLFSSTTLPSEWRLDISHASDDEILQKASMLVGEYIRSLEFAFDSPYDRFLKRNGFEPQLQKSSSVDEYNVRLITWLEKLRQPIFIKPSQINKFKLIHQEFRFGVRELAGLKVFVKEGQCIKCHKAPMFTDFSFHNTGVSQLEYDSVFGPNTFAQLKFPTWSERQKNIKILPPNPKNINGTGQYASPTDKLKPELTDLGVWNMVGNPSISAGSRENILQLLSKELKITKPKTTSELGFILDQSVARFKTPTLRILAQSNPYFHNGSAKNLHDVVHHYVIGAALARDKKLRNGDPIIEHIELSALQMENLVLFLQALNEDYD